MEAVTERPREREIPSLMNTESWLDPNAGFLAERAVCPEDAGLNKTSYQARGIWVTAPFLVCEAG